MKVGLGRGIASLFDELGLGAAIEKAAFPRSRGVSVRWELAEVQEFSHHSGGFLVDRARFDRLLLDEAENAGAQLFCPGLASIENRNRSGSGSTITIADSEGIRKHLIAARFVIDASGRRRVSGGGRERISPRTFALCGHWRGEEFRAVRTVVEAAPWGWAWGASLGSGVFSAIAFLDPDSLVAVSDNSVSSTYRELLGNLRLFSPTRTSNLDQEARSCDATTYLSEELIGDNWLKVGEAAFTVDPLSSQGVHLAIVGAVQAATVVHTILAKPERLAAAERFYRDRQRETVERNVATSVSMYGRCEIYRAEPFWQQRADLVSATRPSSTRATMLRPPTPTAIIGLAPGVTLARTPVISGEFVDEKTALCHPDLDRPVAFLSGTEIARLLEDSRLPRQFDQLMRRWEVLLSATTARNIFRWLWEHRILKEVRTLSKSSPSEEFFPITSRQKIFPEG